MKKTRTIVCMVIGLTIAFSFAVRTVEASPYTVSDIDSLYAIGLKKKGIAPKTNSDQTSPAVKGAVFTRDLQIGSRGEDVQELQKFLGITPPIKYFGELTKAAVIKYQLSKGITPATGQVGEMTRAALEKDIAATASVSSPPSAAKGDTSTKDLQAGSKEKALADKASTGAPPPAVKGAVFTRDLQIGSRGADVTALQKLIGIAPPIGVFGELTKAAVIKYQLSKGITPATGQVGEKTRAALNANAGEGPRP